MESKTFYDDLSSLYDLMFPLSTQQDRLEFMYHLFAQRCVKRVLDAGCGTGRQAIELSRQGYIVTGADNSQQMLSSADKNAREGGVELDLVLSDFASLDQHKGLSDLDAVICIGNSLPHVKDDKELAASVTAMVNVMRGGGLLVLHLRNYARVLAERNRLMPTLAGAHNNSQYLFQRIIDFMPDGRLNFNVLTLQQQQGKWTPHIQSTLQYPATAEELQRILGTLGVTDVQLWGGFDIKGTPYTTESENLVLVATKPG